MSPPTKLALKGLRKTFGKKVVLDHVDLEVARGESLAIIGGSGTGKSVTLKCILGLLHPDGGRIEIDGEDVVPLKGRDRERTLLRLGMLFQNAALFDSLSVVQNVAFGLVRGKGMSPDQARPIALANMEKVGLGADVADADPASLSVGMRKRVGLARAIATEPEIIFFDEPTTGLDPLMGDVIDELIVERSKELGATTLTITHDMGSARTIADRVAMLHGGRIIWAGHVDEIDTCGVPEVEQFVQGRIEGPIQPAWR
ncbi:MAG: ATP-binding cassette domain-containing protein [Alphaproteobacteria bacterium]